MHRSYLVPVLIMALLFGLACAQISAADTVECTTNRGLVTKSSGGSQCKASAAHHGQAAAKASDGGNAASDAAHSGSAMAEAKGPGSEATASADYRSTATAEASGPGSRAEATADDGGFARASAMNGATALASSNGPPTCLGPGQAKVISSGGRCTFP